MSRISTDSIKLAMSCGAVSYSPAPMRAVRGLSFTYDQLAAFTEALRSDMAQEGSDHETVRVNAQALADVLRTIHGPSAERAPQDAAYRNAVHVLVEDLARAQEDFPAEAVSQQVKARP